MCFTLPLETGTGGQHFPVLSGRAQEPQGLWTGPVVTPKLWSNSMDENIECDV